MNEIVAGLLDMIPDQYRSFEKTEYPMPVSQALLGRLPDVAALRGWLREASEGELKNLCEPVAVASEIVESKMADRDQFYMDDNRVRGYVFRGGKWRSGWVFLAGKGIEPEFVDSLNDLEYLTFSTHHIETLRAPHPPRDIHAVPTRQTGAVYFLQLMVRYAMTWGQIPPGDDHEMGHFLERDMPGAMIVRGEIGDIEGLLLLALMKMGCPAVVDGSFPYDVGPRAVAEKDEEFVRALREFPNMRVRIFHGKELSLPEGADPLNAREELVPSRILKGLLQLRPGKVEEGVEVAGDPGEDCAAITIEVDDAKLDLPITAYLEDLAIRFCSYLKGISAVRTEGDEVEIALAECGPVDAERLGQVIVSAMHHKFPRMGPIRVRFAFGEKALEKERVAMEPFSQARQKAIRSASEENTDEFYLCIDCQPFSQAHTCVITPDRPPVCGRLPDEIKAGAIWGVDYRPWTRRKVGSADLQHVVPKGEAVDASAGEWSGINAAVSELTEGKIRRMRLHAVGEFPPSSCGCFAAIAFKIPGIDGIGVMHRSYAGEAPGGLNAIILANRAGGKQFPGVTGFNPRYFKSRKVFAAEGGLKAVKWATRQLYEKMIPYLPEGARVATEDDATTLEELAAFLGRRKPSGMPSR